MILLRLKVCGGLLDCHYLCPVTTSGRVAHVMGLFVILWFYQRVCSPKLFDILQVRHFKVASAIAQFLVHLLGEGGGMGGMGGRRLGEGREGMDYGEAGNGNA